MALNALLVAHILLTMAGYVGLIAANVWLLALCHANDAPTLLSAVKTWRRMARLFGPLLGLGVLIGFGLAALTNTPLASGWLVAAYMLIVAAFAAQASLMVPWQLRAESTIARGERLSRTPVVSVLSVFTVAYVAIVSLMVACRNAVQGSMRFPLLIAVLAFVACAPHVDPLANGRAIFTTGRDLQGNRITASPRPYKSSCVQCHRADGSGGVHLPGGAVSADLRHHALVDEQKHPYTIASLERAISTGVDNEGETLNPVMPRWRMSKTDLRDVATYVYEKLK